MEANRIVAAQIRAAHTLELRFADGFVAKIDLLPALWGPVFEPLKDESFFARFRLEDDTIRWPNDADFCPDVLRYWCEAGSVRSQADTDAYFASQPSAVL